MTITNTGDVRQEVFIFFKSDIYASLLSKSNELHIRTGLCSECYGTSTCKYLVSQVYDTKLQRFSKSSQKTVWLGLCGWQDLGIRAPPTQLI